VLRAGKKGDSVAAVARRYRVSAGNVAQWNQVGATSRFAAGSSIVVYVPVKSAGKRAVATHKPVRKKSATASLPPRVRVSSAKR
jgi:membrane-bound lytic murein transglycosylase D